MRYTLELICVGCAIKIMSAVIHDNTGLLGEIRAHLQTLRDGKRLTTNMLSKEEQRFMQNLALFLAAQNRLTASCKIYNIIRSFITFHGIFMASGYQLGFETVWDRLGVRNVDYEW